MNIPGGSNHEYSEILELLKKWKITYAKIPDQLQGFNKSGDIFVKAFPIQGLLKYHGLSNYNHRIANFSSISFNNSAAYTISYVKLNENLASDKIIFNGKHLTETNPEYHRFQHQINFIRQTTQIHSKALIITRNIMVHTNNIASGKGLGFSASGGAALAHAFMGIIYGKKSDYVQNATLRSIFARYMAGSATRSTVGGIGLWLNDPLRPPMDNFAIRLDRPNLDSPFIQDICLITIPISSSVKTDQAHHIAPQSPFYLKWQENRLSQIQQCLDALYNHNFEQLARLAEFDTLCLHAVTMTSSIDNDFLLWTPETVKIMHLVRNLRSENIPVFFNIDTGPSVVLMTLQQYKNQILETLKEKFNESHFKDIIVGNIAGESEIIESTSEYAHLLQGDIEKYGE